MALKTQLIGAHSDGTDPLWNTAQAAAYLGCSMAALEKWRCVGGGPSYVKLGGMVRYRRSLIDQWLEARSAEKTEGRRRKVRRA